MNRVEHVDGPPFVDPDARRRAEAPGDRLADHLPDLRTALEEQRRFRLEQLAGFDPMTEAAGDACPTADAPRREVALAVADAARQALLDIEIALALIEVGDYGRCRGCRTDIPLRLLRTIPASRWCLDCRQRLAPVDGPDSGSIPRRSRQVGRARDAVSRRQAGSARWRARTQEVERAQ